MRKLFAAMTGLAFVMSVSFGIFADDVAKSSTEKAKEQYNKAKTQVSYQTLPDSVKTAVGKVCPEPDITNITKEEYSGEPAYKFTCTKNGKSEYYWFSESGKQVKKESAKSDKK